MCFIWREDAAGDGVRAAVFRKDEASGAACGAHPEPPSRQAGSSKTPARSRSIATEVIRL